MGTFRRSGKKLSTGNHSAISGAGEWSHPELERRIGVLEGGSSGAVGGRIPLSVPGILAIGPDLAPLISSPTTFRAGRVIASVKPGFEPDGADIVIEIYVGGTLWMTLTIADGDSTVEAEQSQLDAASEIAADANIRLDITAVGTPGFSGAHLTVTIDPA